MNERETIDRGWYYVREPEQGRWAPAEDHIVADDGAVLTRRLHGFPGHLETVDASGASLSVATLLRAAGAVGRALEGMASPPHLLVELGPAGTVPARFVAPDGREAIRLDGVAVAASPSHHPIEAQVAALLSGLTAAPAAPSVAGLPEAPAPRAMFFESLMNTDMPHNDKEISQGVLHLVSALKGTGTEVVLVNAKMPIVGSDRPVWGLEKLEEALAQGPVQLVAITLLEGYWEGVLKLIGTLRSLGCRAHIAVGGVMPTLAPEHVAAHLPEVSFVCRGAGEPFIPALASIVGSTSIDEPFSVAQRQALLALRGVLAVERAGPLRLLSCDSAHTVLVESLDRIDLDLSHLQAHHVQGGIEIATSRGCIHKCSFCSILGRESYQARSAGSVFDLLRCYEARFHELFGEHVPPDTYRVHVSDDDFACDRDRARAFFLGLLDTPFRLSSAQVAVGDLCRREGGKLLLEPDHQLLDAIRPVCFADHGRPIPKDDFFEDHHSRTWSSFLQIGVETYDDREIARLGKGYRRAHIRMIVAELARRGLHMDGYFILSNAETSAEDLVAVFTEVARLKLRFPEHFHMRFPVVQRLVSYFTAASHRRHVRRGRFSVMKLRGYAAVPGHPELDYPFVDHDLPEDAWVERTVDRTFVTDQGVYTGNLTVLSALWRQWLDALPAGDPERSRIGRLIRALDDRPRRLVFEMVRQAWLQDDEGWPGAQLDRNEALATAERVLGPHELWLGVLKTWLKADPERRVVLAIPAPDEVVSGALDLLFASDAPQLLLHLIAPHGSVPAEQLLDVADRARAQARAQRVVRPLRLVLDADGWTATPELAAALAERGVEVQAVRRLPGDVDTTGLSTLVRAGVVVRGILQPGVAVTDLRGPWSALRAAGVHEVHIEPVAEPWDDASARHLAAALHGLAAGGHDALACLWGPPERSGQVGELLVDRDGSLGRSDGLVPGAALRPDYRIGHLDDLTGSDRHALDLLEGSTLRGIPRPADLRKRTAKADQVLTKFKAWLRSQAEVEARASA